ncbi:hypothetical protein ACA910_007684 [Epithemia clementina (nom. ined.)]
MSLTALFDFALAGPLLGLMASFCFLVAGIEWTSHWASPQLLSFSPTITVNDLKFSTLGAAVVDYLVGGGSGFLTLQDDSSEIPLHPMAMAGYVGLLINALELLPSGATDGGRLTLAVFGRGGHALITSLVWVFLLLSTFLFDRSAALLSVFCLYGITQADIELPCRDEVTPISGGRVVLAFVFWFLAFLIVVPMSN